jgi:hypothetical protein
MTNLKSQINIKFQMPSKGQVPKKFKCQGLNEFQEVASLFGHNHFVDVLFAFAI